MDQSSLMSLIERIDSALARIDRAVTRKDATMVDLSRRHEALKAAVGEVLGEIDALVTQGGK